MDLSLPLSVVETIINKPIWLLVFLPVGLALALVLQTVRCWLAR